MTEANGPASAPDTIIHQRLIVCYETNCNNFTTSISKSTLSHQTSMLPSVSILTPSTPDIPNCYCSKGSAPYWSNPLYLIFDIWALSPERQSAQMSKIKNSGLDRYGKV